jgi:transcription elongation factor GreA
MATARAISAPTRGTRRPSTRSRTAAAATAPARPRVCLTRDGRVALHHRLERLRTEVLAPLGEMIGDPEHDRRIDDDYDRAFAEAVQLEQLLAEAADVTAPEDRRRIELGSLVDVRFDDGSVERMRLVHAAEAFIDDERVSVDAPVARALIGRRLGDSVDVKAPAGVVTVEVVGVWQPEMAAA